MHCDLTRHCSRELVRVQGEVKYHAPPLDVAVAMSMQGRSRAMSEAQPSGTVTLVFTDVEGSTSFSKGWARTHTATRSASTAGRARRIPRSTRATRSTTRETRSSTHSLSAEHAVSAVSEAMVGLEAGPIRIRVGIHTGEPALDPPKYVGMDVHRAARIMSAAHGGQVVLSPSTVSLLEPESFDLTDLGEHRLKDIDEAIAIFQLGDGAFPPLKTISSTNLPRPASSFVGREAELREVLARIEGRPPRDSHWSRGHW